MSDFAALVIQSIQRDEAAFRALVDHFKNMAYGYAYSIVGDFHLAEDVTQEAFIEADSDSTMWYWQRHDAWLHIAADELDEAERIVRQAVSTEGYRWYAPMLIQIVARRGEPTPADLREQLNGGGVDAVDDYGLFGKYLSARIAAEADDKRKALSALEKALDYWRNPPLSFIDVWENDIAWRKMRQSTERKRLFEAKKKSIGPIFGELHYFPSW